KIIKNTLKLISCYAHGCKPKHIEKFISESTSKGHPSPKSLPQNPTLAIWSPNREIWCENSGSPLPPSFAEKVMVRLQEISYRNSYRKITIASRKNKPKI